MSQYVEARYALLTLHAAREASPEQAQTLLSNLLTDLGSRQQDRADHRASVIAAIRHLVLILQEHRTPPVFYWETAARAAHLWCEEAAE
ncbi:hypothetical protein [Bradyrhizobium guangdongense]|uniref:Uncharacterized protein n=1 Tax=Bradyrhizobium guangdongense TaxID=1325090 RepID=A0A410V3U3_9BRAD|nr:hypothetical protein [Bradyrhizobium guangdongense]QAU38344.1 hypothetical protein X265_12160 [Bradyrhizobium guangdongense]QOZ59399.1 hypothetical protein XH86_12160 [Bradyrhizobium guangdongense]GGI34353.1 hypothetical protein GCM10010987_78970 [Bradyrhizobium guangdongense]